MAKKTALMRGFLSIRAKPPFLMASMAIRAKLGGRTPRCPPAHLTAAGPASIDMKNRFETINHIRALRREAERAYARGDRDGGRILEGFANRAEEEMWARQHERARAATTKSGRDREPTNPRRPLRRQS